MWRPSPLQSIAAAVVAAGGTTGRATPSSIIPPPLWEPTATDFFGSHPAGEGLLQLDRVRGISSDDFQRRVRLGHPFIIEDAGRGNPFLGKDCAWYQETFPQAKMRAEYTNRDERWFKIGGERWSSEGRATRPPPGHVAGEASTFNAPYVWHVKDGGHEAPPPIKAKVQEMWRPAYFIESALNLREANESQEFWFSLRNGSVMAHADTYCISAVSLQLRGQKRWRLMPSPPPIPSSLARYDAHDGGVYKKAGLWKPTHEAVVNEGEAIVFFPHQFHETFVPEDNPQCTVATTFQFQQPLPVRFIRAYLPTLSQSHLYYEGHCKDLWHSLPTLQAPAVGNGGEEPFEATVRRWKASDDAVEVREQAHRLMAMLDQDHDGDASLNEVEAYLAEPTRRWARWFYTEDYFYEWRPSSDAEKEIMSAELLRGRVRDTLWYHDLDSDGLISQAELEASLLQWNVVHHKLKEETSLRGRKAAVRKLAQRYERYRSWPERRSAPSFDGAASNIEL